MFVILSVCAYQLRIKKDLFVLQKRSKNLARIKVTFFVT